MQDDNFDPFSDNKLQDALSEIDQASMVLGLYTDLAANTWRDGTFVRFKSVVIKNLTDSCASYSKFANELNEQLDKIIKKRKYPLAFYDNSAMLESFLPDFDMDDLSVR